MNSARRHGLGSDSVLFTTTLISLFSCVLDDEDAETAVKNKKDQIFIFSEKKLIFIFDLELLQLRQSSNHMICLSFKTRVYTATSLGHITRANPAM